MEDIPRSPIHIDLTFELIQAIRLTHALSESEYQICIDKKHLSKFSYLKRFFNLDITTYDNSEHLNGLRISHDIPKVHIGSIERPLIFPLASFEYCKNIWPSHKSAKFSFAGNVNDKRKKALEKWGRSWFTELDFTVPQINPIKKRLLKPFRKFIPPSTNKKHVGPVLFWSSERGRRFPIKAWDDQYFQLLADTQFVICPNGDFIWTYRFFEAVMCGAIPIVEDFCPLYEDFKFKTFQDDPKTFSWSYEDAIWNFELCKQKLTVPIDILNSEINELLSKDKLQCVSTN